MLCVFLCIRFSPGRPVDFSHTPSSIKIIQEALRSWTKASVAESCFLQSCSIRLVSHPQRYSNPNNYVIWQMFLFLTHLSPSSPLGRLVYSWLTCQTTATTGWACTPLSHWWGLCSAGLTCACRHCLPSDSLTNTSRFSRMRETPCGRFVHLHFHGYYWVSSYRECYEGCVPRTSYFTPKQHKKYIYSIIL